MAVGSIADELLVGTAAGKRARQILGSNLRTASVWADCAKGVGSKSFKYGGAGHYPECAVYENPASQRAMEAFVRRNVGNCVSAPDGEVCHKEYHYTDVAIQRDRYRAGLVGTNDHDIVAAVSAAVAVLQGQASPAPFRMTSKKEALRVLAHYVGDIHQPLHVAAVYLDDEGHLVDPDHGTYDPRTKTDGGNTLFVKSQKLHGKWDAVVATLGRDPVPATVLKEARGIAVTAGPIEQWSTAWATESVDLGHRAFEGLQYSRADDKHHYQVTLPEGYSGRMRDVQHDQVVKAGARLAQILRTIWP